MSTNSRTLPIVVGGFYRSGSSLVRRLLDAHSRIHCGPEVKFFRDFYGDYIRDELGHIRFFSTLAALGLTEQERLMLFGQAFVRSHELAASKAGKQRWADKCPENVLFLDQWQQLLPHGFVFVHVVRNPLDALASLKEAVFPLTVPSSFRDRVLLYSRFFECGSSYAEKFPDRSITLRYENLVGDPVGTLAGLMDRLGEAFEPRALDLFSSSDRGDGIEDPKIKHTKAVVADSVGRWQHDLDAEETELARRLLSVLSLPE